jgi:hypothetical protein
VPTAEVAVSPHQCPEQFGGQSSTATKLKRKSYFVDERPLSRAKRALGVKTEAEAIRLSLERGAEMAEFWELMKKSRWSLKPGSVEKS